MKRKLLINLLIAWLLSSLLSGVLFGIWYNIKDMGFEERQLALFLFALMALGLPLIMALLTLPFVWMIRVDNHSRMPVKWLYLLAGPAIVMLLFCLMIFAAPDAESLWMLFISVVSFVLLHVLLYGRLQRQIRHASSSPAAASPAR